MDAYGIANAIKNLWVLSYNKNSGLIDKNSKDINVYVNGKKVVGVETNADGRIELKAENEA